MEQMVFDDDQISGTIAYYHQTAQVLAGVGADLEQADLGYWAGESYRPLADAYIAAASALAARLGDAAAEANSVATMLARGATDIREADAEAATPMYRAQSFDAGQGTP